MQALSEGIRRNSVRNPGGIRSYADDAVKTELFRRAAHQNVPFLGKCAQFPHSAQHRKTSAGAGKPRYGMQGGLHGIRVGIVGVIHYQNAVDPGAVKPAAREPRLIEAGGDLLFRKTCRPASGGGQKRIGYHVPAVDGQFHLFPAEIRDGKDEACPVLSRDGIFRANGSGVNAAVNTGSAGGLTDHIRIIAVRRKNHEAVFRQAACQRAFFPGDIFPRTQIFHVGGADAGDDADFRARHFTQGSQFPGVVHAHFPYGGFVGRGGPEDAEGDADVVVQVTLRGDGAKSL